MDDSIRNINATQFGLYNLPWIDGFFKPAVGVFTKYDVAGYFNRASG